jgi:hypothetical protein
MTLNEFRQLTEACGVDIELIANIPFIYIDKINGEKVTEPFNSEQGFCIAFVPLKTGEETMVTDLEKVTWLLSTYVV